MDVEFPTAGKYIVAVSGGVDSVVLLDLLVGRPGLELVVAHFDHGMRQDSAKDQEFVQALAKKYGLVFEHAEGGLGPRAGEAAARQARYEFLRKMLNKYGAVAIITAHHQDDVLETAILNMLRGTGRRGLTSLKSGGDIRRPLLKTSKEEILNYARQRGLAWHEDPTNQDEAYQRNYVRHKILPRFSPEERAKLLGILGGLEATNQEMDELLAGVLAPPAGRLDRRWFNGLPHGVAREVMAAWLRQNEVRDFDRKGLERLVVAAKTAKPLSSADVLQGVKMVVSKDDLALVLPER